MVSAMLLGMKIGQSMDRKRFFKNASARFRCPEGKLLRRGTLHHGG